MTVPKPKLRWFQYSLRTLLVIVTLCGIPCSWLAVKLQQARREHEVAAAIEKLRVRRVVETIRAGLAARSAGG